MKCMEKDFLIDDFIGETELMIKDLKEMKKKQTWISLYEKSNKNADILIKPKF
jgi:hypothetical protein